MAMAQPHPCTLLDLLLMMLMMNLSPVGGPEHRCQMLPELGPTWEAEDRDLTRVNWSWIAYLAAAAALLNLLVWSTL